MVLEKNKTIFISPTAFKDSISARGLTEFIKSYLWNRGFFNLSSFVGSDGGNGFLDAMAEIHDRNFIQVNVPGLLGHGTRTENVLRVRDGFALETSSVIGIEQVNESARNVYSYTSYPLGVLIKNLCEKFPEIATFHIGVGGTATLDFGIGMLAGLGFRFYDINGQSISPTLSNLASITSIVPAEYKELNIVFYQDVHVDIVSDKESFIEVFGPQKGLKPNQIVELKQVLALMTERFELNTSISGCGGGLGLFPSKYLKTGFASGTSYFTDSFQFAEKYKAADLIITGEGRLDQTTFKGKWCSAFLDSEKPVLCLTGMETENLTIPKLWEVESLQKIEPDRMKSIRQVKPIIREILDKHIRD